MSVEEMLTLVLGLFIVSVVVIAANYADRYKSARTWKALVAIVLLINALVGLSYGVLPVVSVYAPQTVVDTPPTAAEAWGALLMTLVVVGLTSALLRRSVRLKAARLFPRYRGETVTEGAGVIPGTADLFPQPEGQALFPQMLNYYTTDSIAVPRSVTASEAGGRLPGASSAAARPTWRGLRGFDPDSAVHATALILCVYLLGVQAANFLLEGGLSGVAESYETGLTAWDLLLNAAPFVVVALLGVGLGLRRDWSQALQRLGVEKVSWEGVGMAIAATFALFFFVGTVGVIWKAVVPENVYEEQTQASDALAESVTSIGLAFLLALTAALGEEIAFRGALQPVLGLWPTAIVFALTHAQYTLTPAWLIILGVALVFGWIRQRYNTTVSMLTHFLYNFIPLALSVSVPEGLIVLLHLLT